MNNGWSAKYPNPALVFNTDDVTNPSTFHFPGVHPNTSTFLTEQVSFYPSSISWRRKIINKGNQFQKGPIQCLVNRLTKTASKFVFNRHFVHRWTDKHTHTHTHTHTHKYTHAHTYTHTDKLKKNNTFTISRRCK